MSILAYLQYVQSDASLPKFKAMTLSSPNYPSTATAEQQSRSRNVDWCWNTITHTSALQAYHSKAGAAQASQFPYQHTSQASLDHLALLPPTHIHIAEIDFLAREGLQLAGRLLDAGVPLSTEVN
jgi:acetyl esterase/lipase